MEDTAEKIKKPIINCHTHIFTGDHVPPWLAKTFLPWPFYYLFSLRLVVQLFRIYYNKFYRGKFDAGSKQEKKTYYAVKVFILRNLLIRIIAFIIGWWLTIHVFFILFAWIASLVSPGSNTNGKVNDIKTWLQDHQLLFIPESIVLKILMVIIVVLFVKTGRNLIVFIFKKIWSFFAILPGPQTKELIKRYLTIGRFSFHAKQEKNYEQLRNQYPEDTGFVILPMDMEFMDAGRLKENFRYHKQMEILATIKANPAYHDKFFPFVFADPRRIVSDGNYFRYTVKENSIILEDCFIKKFIEEKKFSGFKIYPALGYFPFDISLLPLWKYAADNEIPVLTHCIRGNIFYRGAKKKVWDHHPVFDQAAGEGNYEPLLLEQMKNIEFINNFTHPLNYLCLLEEKLLRKLIHRLGTAETKTIFGYSDENTPLQHDLHHLKICFGHYGGEDEWEKFFESDRDSYSSQLLKQPGWGIDFLTDDEGEEKPGKPEYIWKNVDWYSITSSIMLQFPNVYSDLSYILHAPSIVPLLAQTMNNEKLRYKVLYGTDFYVVRNHKSDKQLLAEMISNLSEHSFDLIARDNPRVFLKNKIHGEVGI